MIHDIVFNFLKMCDNIINADAKTLDICITLYNLNASFDYWC